MENIRLVLFVFMIGGSKEIRKLENNKECDGYEKEETQDGKY